METSTSTSSANLGPYIPAALRLREQVGPLLGAGTCNAKPTRPGRRGRDATGARPLWWPLQWPGPLNTLRPATRSARNASPAPSKFNRRQSITTTTTTTATQRALLEDLEAVCWHCDLSFHKLHHGGHRCQQQRCGAPRGARPHQQFGVGCKSTGSPLLRLFVLSN